MTRDGRVQCPWDWSEEKPMRSLADKVHIKAAMWAEPYEQEPPRESDEREFFLMRLWEHRELQAALDAALAEGVREARRYGATWDDVGKSLGVTRQAAQMRFGKV